MAHIQFASHLLGNAREYLGDGILALGLLAEHILRARLLGETHRGDTGTLLPPVVLFLHHQVELVEAVGPRAVLPLVIVERPQQANHRHTTLMFQLLHLILTTN